MYKFNSISEIREANKAINNHWFDRKTMSFFNTRIETAVLKGRFFVTSEKTGFASSSRKCTLRMAKEDGSIKTIGEFGQFYDVASAKDFLSFHLSQLTETTNK
jgi:hypothetical protein